MTITSVDSGCKELETRIRFPDDPFFTKLLATAARHGDSIIIRDETDSTEANYPKLLFDVHTLRQLLQDRLPANLLDGNGMVKEEGTSIAVIARGGYKFLVASIAIFAIGAVVLPLNPGYIAEEALYFLTKCNVVAMLTDPFVSELASSIHEQIQIADSVPVMELSITFGHGPLQQKPNFITTSDLAVNSDRPALLLLTSGTTGAPKIVAHTRRFYYRQPEPSCQPNDVYLSQRAFFWIGGFREFIAMLLKGVRLEMICYTSRAVAVWERLRKGDITCMSAVPSLLSNMMRVYEEKLCHLPGAKLQLYTNAVGNLRSVKCTGGLMSTSVKKFWCNLLIQTKLEINYAGTEIGGVGLSCLLSDEDTINSHCIGKPVPGVSIKLNGGDRGELLIKSPTLFTRYLDGAEDTKAAFDDDGFYRTGDLATRATDGRLFIEGRSKADFIRSRGLNVPILEVEQHLLNLPYISEAYVVPVLNVFGGGQQVAAVIRLRKNSIFAVLDEDRATVLKLSLHTLRLDLSVHLAEFKLPTLLRILTDEEDIPRSQAGKSMPKEIVPRFFPQPVEGSLEGLPADVQQCNIIIRKGPVAWDRGALRC